MSRYLIIAARMFGIFAIGFISLFALDALPDDGFEPVMLIGLVIHLVPSFVLLALLALAWKFPAPGGIIFLLISAAPFVFLSNPFATNVMLAGPFFLTGALFLSGALLRR